MIDGTNIRIFPLDVRGKEYVLAHLGDVNTFCSALLETVSREEGDVFTIAPATTPLEKLYKFEEGGLLPEHWSQAIVLPGGQGTLVPKASLRASHAQRVLESLSNLPGGVCIVDDFNPIWGEALHDLGPYAFGVGKEVYHLLTGSEDSEAVEQVLHDGDTIWHGLAAVCARAPIISVTRESTAEELQACAGTVVEITCTAYDGEGFVGWRATV